jgi:hypothetical protein
MELYTAWTALWVTASYQVMLYDLVGLDKVVGLGRSTPLPYYNDFLMEFRKAIL